MIKIRITPLLKTLGFQKGEFRGHYIRKDQTAEARVYKINEDIRVIDMWRNVFHTDGSIDHRELLLKRFPLDQSANGISESYEEFLYHMAAVFETYKIVDNQDYYFGKTDMKLVEDRVIC